MNLACENQTAIITGAASGLGLAIAKRLSEHKVKLALYYHKRVSACRYQNRAGKRHAGGAGKIHDG